MFSRSKSIFSVISPYSALLHGPSRAPAARCLPQVPFEFWLAARNAVAPFRDSCLVIGNDHDISDIESFTNSAKEHFKNVIDFKFPLIITNNEIGQQQQQQNKILPLLARQDDENKKLVLSLHSKVRNSFLSSSSPPQTNSLSPALVDHNNNKTNLLDAVILSPSCTSSASSLVEDFDKKQKMLKSSPEKTKKSKLISSPQDLHFAFQSFAPLLKPHGILCITGTDILSSSQILCGGKTSAAKETQQDWQDLCEFLKSKSTEDELYLDLVRTRNDHDEGNNIQDEESSSSSSSVFDYDRFAEIQKISNNSGLVNTTYFEFETEYPLDDNFQFLSGIVRRIPAYRRMISNDLAVEKFNEEEEEVFSFRRRSCEEGGKNEGDLVDPLECFVNLAKMRNINKEQQTASSSMRLKLKHWMWVCDKRPRSKDSISFASRRK